MTDRTVTDSETGHCAEGLVRILQGSGHVPFPATPGPPPLPPGTDLRKG
jgi:hypothetical protein